MKQRAFREGGRFYKGNLHMHTTISDGTRPLEEAIGIYKNKGYDFVAVTDHNHVFKSDEFNDEIYIIPGLEIHSNKEGEDKTHHMVALTTYDNPVVSHGQLIENEKWTDSVESCNNLVSRMKSMGFELIYAHSVWSRIEPEEFANKEFMAMEIYNGVCDYMNGQGYQDFHWDKLMRKGFELWGVATDDSHNVDAHYGRGFVMVKSDELSDKAILKALKEGAFYSSRGPEIYDFYISDNVAYVRCSPAVKISFIAYESRGRSFNFDIPSTEAKMPIRKGMDYIRVEIVDENGMKAWTNPLKC